MDTQLYVPGNKTAHLAPKNLIDLKEPSDERIQIYDILSPEALTFLTALETQFRSSRKTLLKAREERQKAYDKNKPFGFNPQTRDIRKEYWATDAVPHILEDRRVELCGGAHPTDIQNAIKAGAKTYCVDLENAQLPRFTDIVQAQLNIQSFTKTLIEAESPMPIMICPRALDREDTHLELNGAPLSASLLDFGLHIFHNGKTLADKCLGPFYVLPKLENHLEARLWNDVFIFAQEYLDIKKGTIKALALIETLPAAFEMEEILYELRQHSAGLRFNSQSYITSYIKTLGHHPEFVLPDIEDMHKDQAFLNAVNIQLVKTCHRRGAHAIGDLGIQPLTLDAKTQNIQEIRAMAVHEAELYFDGVCLHDPTLLWPVRDVFNISMPSANNLHRLCREKTPNTLDMLCPHHGDISEQGVRAQIAMALENLSDFLAGQSPKQGLSIAERISAQLWQWIDFGCAVRAEHNHYEDRAHVITMTAPFFKRLLSQEVEKLEYQYRDDTARLKRLSVAKQALSQSVLSERMNSSISQYIDLYFTGAKS